MAFDKITYALCKKYTDNEVAGAGAIKGKNAVIDSIVNITGGHRVTFKWELDNGTVQTDTMDVMDGVTGPQGPQGPAGPKGDTGAAGAQGPKGDTGAAGEAGPKGDTGSQGPKGDKGDKGDTGATGAQGPKGDNGLTPVITITDITGGHQVTVTVGTDTETFNVMDGTDGADGHDGAPGQGVPSGGASGQILSKNSNGDYDTKWIDPAGASQEQSDWGESDSSKVSFIKNKPINLVQDANYVHTDNNYTTEDKTKLAGLQNYDDTALSGRVTNIENVIPSGASSSDKLAKSSDIPDVSNFITNTVNDLANYYLKSETYTKVEITALIAAISTFKFEVVSSLPTTDISTTTVYLVPKSTAQTNNFYDEYICIDDTTTPATWEKIGDTQIDLSGKADKVASATSGNFAGLDANGNLTDSGRKPSDFLTSHQDISGKADKVSGSTNGNFAGLDANGNITDSGSRPSDFLTSHQDISGKADKVASATSGNFAGLDANGNLTDSGSKPSDFLTSHQDISGKADKVSGATNGNFAGLDANGNITDSGKAASDFQPAFRIGLGLDMLSGSLINKFGEFSGTPSAGHVPIFGNDGEWHPGAAPSGGHEMIPVSGDIDALKLLSDGSDNYVLNAYTAKRWANCDVITLLTTVSQGTDTVGDWDDDWKAEGASRDGWLWSADLYHVLEDGNGNSVLDIEITPVFDIVGSEVISLYAFRIDDDYTLNGVPGGCVAFKFNNAIASASGVKVGLNLKHQRINVNNFTVIDES